MLARGSPSGERSIDHDTAFAGVTCVEPKSLLRDIKEAARLDDPVLLSANHRNPPEIARVAEYFHAGDAPVPEVHRPGSGEPPRVFLYREDGATGRIANTYGTRGGRVGVAVVNNETGEALYSRLRNQLAGQRVEIYTSYRKTRTRSISWHRESRS